jgi:hypothetical protein
MTISERLLNAIGEVARMEHPSVAGLLRKYGYGYEAGKVEEMLSIYKDIPAQSETGGQKQQVPVIQQAIGIITDLLNTCELNLDEVERDTESSVAAAREFLARMKQRGY